MKAASGNRRRWCSLWSRSVTVDRDAEKARDAFGSIGGGGAFSDGVVTLGDADVDQLELFCDMEQDEDTRPYIINESLEKHLARFGRNDVRYKCVLDRAGEVIGFVILILDPDGRSVEFGRIVLARKGRTYGSRAVALVERVCTEQLGRRRVWLDVFDFNSRAQHVYEKNGYRRFGAATYRGQKLKLYEKEL